MFRCQREHSRRDALIRAQTSDYFRGVALFIADLSTRIDEPDLMDAVPELLLTLLSRTTTDNVKCACNILKVRSIIDSSLTYHSNITHMLWSMMM